MERVGETNVMQGVLYMFYSNDLYDQVNLACILNTMFDIFLALEICHLSIRRNPIQWN